MRRPSLLLLPLLWLAPSTASASDYLGAGACRACHEPQYQQWRRTAHARAGRRLERAERRDPRCAQCHATSAVDGLYGVQCESCHGPGRHYWQEYVMRDVELARAIGLRAGSEQAICQRCHTEDGPRVSPFDLTAGLAAVRHQ